MISDSATKHVILSLWEGSFLTINGVGKLGLEELKARQHVLG